MAARAARALTARAVLDLQVSERDFQAAIIEEAELRGWLTHHEFDSRRSRPGYPDLTMTRAGRLIVAELKTTRGRLSIEQKLWLRVLSTVKGIEVYVWRPADRARISEVLA